MRIYCGALFLAVLCAAPAAAADLPTKKLPPEPVVTPTLPSTWRFEFTGYLWGSSVAGSTGFGAQPSLPYYAPFSKLIEHFQGGIMSAFVARNDTFIGGIDFVWSRIGGSATLCKPDNAPYRGEKSPPPHQALLTPPP